MTAKLITCSCGELIFTRRKADHEKSKWHAVASTSRLLRAKGMSYAEIARQVGLTRNYVKMRLSREGL